MNKKLLSLLMAGSMMLGLAACGGNSDPTPTPAESTPVGESATPTAEYTVAMITDYGDITDQSFNQTTYEACKAFCEKNNVGFTYKKPAGDNTADRVAMIENAIDEGYNVVVMPGFAFGEAIKETAETYPEVKFVALDVSEYDLCGESGWTIPSNVYSAVYQEELCGYMAGYASVMLGYEHLGYLGGMGVPAVMRFGYGFLQGADAAAAKLEKTDKVVVEYTYGNQFFGDADITAAMDTWYQTMGVEAVFACGGGIFTSAAEAAAKTGGKVIGVDTDQSPIINAMTGAETTITSATKGLANTVDHLLSEILAGNWDNYGGKVETLGLVSGDDPEANYVQIPMETTQWAEGKFTQEDYKALVKDMFDGKITVSDDISAMPATTIKVNDHGNIK